MTSRITDEYLRSMHGEPQTPQEVVSFDGSVQTTGTLTEGTKYLFQATQDCHIEIGSNPTAVVATSTPVFAFTPYIFTMTAAHKVAAIKASVAGKLYISELKGYRV